MSKKLIFARRILAVVTALTAIFSSSAQTPVTWSNTAGTLTSFATGSNWTGGVAPTDSLTASIAGFGTAPGQQIGFASRSVAGVLFTSGAGAFTLSGGSGIVLTLGASGLVNQSTTGAQQIAATLPLALGTAASFTNSGTTNLTFNSTIDNAGFGLTVGGTGTGVSIVNGAIGGSGGLTKSGTADWRLLGVNTYTGGTTVNQGTLLVNSTGTLPAGGNVVINGTAAGTTSLQVNSTAGQSIGTLTFGGAGAGATATNTLQLNAGTFTLGGNVAYLATNNPGTATIAGSGGTLALNGNRVFDVADSSNSFFELTVNSVISGTGNSITKTGAGALSLRGANTYTGGTVVAAGTLYASNFNSSGSATGTGTVLIQSGAMLRGNGFISGATTIESGGALGPLSTLTPGTLTFSGGLTLLAGSSVGFQLGTLSSDKIVITGGQLAGPASGTITLNLYAPGSVDSGAFAAGTYTLFNFSTGGTTTSSFDVSDFTLGTTISGYTYDLSISGNTLQLTASAIPEPSTYAAIFGALALAGAVWRRRRSTALVTTAVE